MTIYLIVDSVIIFDFYVIIITINLIDDLACLKFNFLSHSILTFYHDYDLLFHYLWMF